MKARNWICGWAAMAVLLFSGSALATGGTSSPPSSGGTVSSNQCNSDADCGNGFTCKSEAVPCAAPACAPGQSCPASNCPDQPVKQCVPAPPPSCKTTSDCSGGLVCVTYTYTACPATPTEPASPPSCSGPNCPQPDGQDAGVSGGSTGSADAGPAKCQATTAGYCLPKYFAPCQKDADCGTGFTCAEQQMCACSGSSGSGTASSGTATPGQTGSTGSEPPTSVDAGPAVDGGPAPSPDAGPAIDGGPAPDAGGVADHTCQCQGTGQHYCKLTQTECNTDSDCPTGLTCQSFAEPTMGVACDSNPDAGPSNCPDASQPPQHKYCAPPGWKRWFGSETPAQASANGGAEYNTAPAAAAGQGGKTVSNRTSDNGFFGNGSSGQKSGSGSGNSKAACETASIASPASALPFLLLIGVFAGFAVKRRRAES